MKLINITAHYKKFAPNNYKFLISQLKKTKDPEEKVRIYIGICTLVFFFIGLSYDTGSYILTGSYLLAKVNILSLFVFLASVFLFQWAKICVSKALALLLFAVQVNVAISIIHNCILVMNDNNFIIYHDLSIGFLVCILAALTLKQIQVHILCLLPLSALATGLAICSPISLAEFFPSLCLAYAAPPIFLTRIRAYLWNSLREKEQLLQGQQALCKLMGMTEQQWNLLIDVVQAPRVSKKQASELFDILQKAISDQLVVKAKQLLASEELMGVVNEKKELLLTAKEVQLCGLILEDKSILEISSILHINESSVRANRSRLRKKLQLKQGADLKAHLMQLIAEEKNDS